MRPAACVVSSARDEECRYLRALAAMYIRMTFRASEVYDLLEPLLKDYRKLRVRSMCAFLSLIFAHDADELWQRDTA